jgi:hypothetical protein
MATKFNLNNIKGKSVHKNCFWMKGKQTFGYFFF